MAAPLDDYATLRHRAPWMRWLQPLRAAEAAGLAPEYLQNLEAD